MFEMLKLKNDAYLIIYLYLILINKIIKISLQTRSLNFVWHETKLKLNKRVDQLLDHKLR